MKIFVIILIISANAVSGSFQNLPSTNQITEDSLQEVVIKLVSQIQNAIYSFVDNLTYQADKEHFIKIVNEILLEFIRLLFDLLPVPSQIKDIISRISACLESTVTNLKEALATLASNIGWCTQYTLKNVVYLIVITIFKIAELVGEYTACKDDNCKNEVVQNILQTLKMALNVYLKDIFVQFINCLKDTLDTLKEKLISTSKESIHCFLGDDLNNSIHVTTTKSIVVDLLELIRTLVDAVVKLWNKIYPKFVPLFTGLSVDGKYKLRLLVDEIWEYVLETIEELKKGFKLYVTIFKTSVVLDEGIVTNCQLSLSVMNILK